MLLIKIFLGSIFFVFYFIDMARIPERWKLNFKPFNCHMCLSVWTAIILYWLPYWITDLILVCFMSGVFAPLFKNFMYNIFFPKK